MQNNFRTDNSESANYLCLNGGCLNIPDERQDEFFGYLICDIIHGRPNYLVEKRRAHAFRYILDLDVDSVDGEVLDDEWHCLYGSIQRTVSQVYPDLSVHQLRMIVCRANTKLRLIDGVQKTKTGRHVIFPDIVVNIEIAMRLRQFIMYNVAKEEAISQCRNLRAERIENLFDATIYEANGFRMLYNHKASKCLSCSRKNRARIAAQRRAWNENGGGSGPPQPRFIFHDCEYCHGLGYIHEGRPYSPYEVFRGDGFKMLEELMRLSEDHAYMFRQTCVRVPLDPPVTPFSDILTNMTSEMTIEEHHRPQQKRNRSTRLLATTAAASAECLISPHDQRFIELDLFIYQNFRHHTVENEDIPENLRVDAHGIRVMKRLHLSDIYIATSISTHCMNKERAMPDCPTHNHSQVYFQVSKDGRIVQRCHCAKVYNNVSCRSVSSSPRWIPQKLQLLLWPPPPPPPQPPPPMPIYHDNDGDDCDDVDDYSSRPRTQHQYRRCFLWNMAQNAYSKSFVEASVDNSGPIM